MIAVQNRIYYMYCDNKTTSYYNLYSVLYLLSTATKYNLFLVGFECQGEIDVAIKYKMCHPCICKDSSNFESLTDFSYFNLFHMFHM